MLVGCGEQTLAQSNVENEITRVVQEQTGNSPKEVRCPGDLAAKVDAKLTCILVGPDGATYNAAVTVSSVKGSDATFDIDVADKPNPVIPGQSAG